MMMITILPNKTYANINVIAYIIETNGFRLQHSPGYNLRILVIRQVICQYKCVDGV